MSEIKITELWCYPLKSARGISFTETGVSDRGIAYDRLFALFDEDLQVITAREYPRLLKLQPGIVSSVGSPNVSATGIDLFIDDSKVVHLPFNANNEKAIPLKVFSQDAGGVGMSGGVDQWFSDFLKVKCRLMFMPKQVKRPILEKYGGKPGQIVSFADVGPIMLLSEASLAELNSRLDVPVTMRHFRPNIIVSGCDAYEEETWNTVQIGNTIYDVLEPCKRCVFTTIHPETLEKRKDGEPLRTLAAYRRHPRGGVSFGVLLVPRVTGIIKVNDLVEVK